METIKINKCEGYLWWSDQQKPRVYQDELIDICLDEAKNPFVVEGQLYDEENKESYSIKYVDGKYHINKYKVNESDLINQDNEVKSYLSNRMDDRWLKFLRYWEEKEDENCMGMPVLTLTKNVFIGFDERKEM
jgi:CRISPR type III-associated protein (TIGR04423 family)